MWQAIANGILSKNNAPAWNRINNILSIAKMAESSINSAKNKKAQQTNAETQGVIQ